MNYEDVTPLEWAEYEFATIEYDYRIPERAAESIRDIFKKLSEREKEREAERVREENKDSTTASEAQP